MTSGSGIIHGFKYLSPVGGREKSSTNFEICSFVFNSYFAYGTYQTLVPYTGCNAFVQITNQDRYIFIVNNHIYSKAKALHQIKSQGTISKSNEIIKPIDKSLGIHILQLNVTSATK